MKKYEVAISKDGTIARCCVVEEKELSSLLIKSDEVEEQKQKEKLDILKRIEDLESWVVELQHEIKVLKGEE